MTQEDRAAVAARIRALLAKTVDKGCTEAEAMASATKAKELMDKYQISLTDAELEAEGFVRGTAERPENRRFNVQDFLAKGIAGFTETKCWSDSTIRGVKRRKVFFGLRSDVEFANWLLKALESFVWAKADDYAIRTGDNDYYAKRTFAMAAAIRIKERLDAETAARASRGVGDGRSLIVVKNALVQREFNKLGLKLHTQSKGFANGGSRHDAAAAGRAAGDQAGFGRPLNGNGDVKRLA